ncbi:hypothetical protein [Streptomyces sp. NPDC058441]|uniref:hypothetical protein n=1 Tax=Streptomyces sp. NPDC058441 TaxID=3346502 RepID=UPI00364E0EAA
MVAIKPDMRTAESMAAGAGGAWEVKPTPVKGKRARKREAADAPKAKFANIDGKRVEVRQARPKDARPYPTAPVTARPGSRIAVAELRGHSDPGIPKLPKRAVGPKLDIARTMDKREQSNNIPFVPEFQAEGQPFPRMARDEEGKVTPRVRTDNGMTTQLQGRGIARRADGKSTYTKRQLAEREAERQAQYAALMDHARYRQVEQDHQDARKDAKRALQDAMGRKRDAIERGDVAAAEAAQKDISRFRKAAKYRA